MNLFVGGFVFLSVFAFATTLLSADASAASLSGTWVSRVDDSGYTQSYMGPYGGTITDSFDAELDLSTSDSSVTGTLTILSETYSVDGSFDGVTFVMSLSWGWDGVSMCEAVYTLTVDGDEMAGSGSYLNVGVTIYGTFDLKKSGGSLDLDLGLGLDALVEYNQPITVVVIGVAVAGLAVTALSVAPKKLIAPRPAMQPSVVGETAWQMPGPPEDGTYLGGAGLQLPVPPPAGAPFPPSEHFTKVSQTPPQCPFHPGTFLTPHFASGMPGEKGSWFCPACNGYPWGQTPKGG
ncbi:MAG: hypothetical protein MUO87_10360 [Thermoplasmata archaeon]|nr:hypothetical protein [Thermoplasmata archaeon]